MAVRISRFGSTQDTVELEGVVLSAAPATARVSSDHAMIDSGNRLRVRFWDAERHMVRTVLYRTDDVTIEATPDASPEVFQLAEKFDKAHAWFGEVQRRYARLVEPVRVGVSPQLRADMTNIAVGDRVEVHKGRKCPLGTYEVARLGFNDYGSYAHLRAADGSWVRYISADNLRRPAATDALLAEAATGGTARPGTEFHALVTGILAAENKLAGWLALTDWLRDQGKDAEADILAALVRDRFGAGAA